MCVCVCVCVHKIFVIRYKKESNTRGAHLIMKTHRSKVLLPLNPNMAFSISILFSNIHVCHVDMVTNVIISGTHFCDFILSEVFHTI